MQLTYGQLERILTSHLAIHPDRVSTFRSRVKQLQRLGFPGGVNVGRGEKMIYTGEHLFKIVTVFELLGMGLPAQFSTKIVEKHWLEFSSGYALSQRIKERHAFKERIYARLILRTLNDLQFARYAFQQKETQVVIEDPSHLEQLLYAHRQRTAFTYPIIVMSDLYSRIIQRAQDEAGIVGAEGDDEVREWLPTQYGPHLAFNKPYPDKAAMAVRTELQALFNNDPEFLPELADDDDVPF